MKGYAPFILLLFTLSLAGTLSGQQLSYRQLTTEDGLPSNEVYDIEADSKGYIWMATDRGVARYDGYGFNLYTTEKGLKHNCVTVIFPEDRFGRLWFLDYSHNLYYLQHDSMHHYPAKLMIDGMRQVIYSLHVREDSSIVLGKRDGRYLITTNGEETQLPDTAFVRHSFISRRDELGDDTHNRGSYFIDLKDKTHEHQYMYKRNRAYSTFDMADDKMVLDGHLLQLDGSKLYELTDFGHTTRNLVKVQDRHYAVVYTKGIYEIEDKNPELIFPKKESSCITLISNKEMWLGTLSDGVFIIKNFNIRQRDVNEYVNGIVANKEGIHYVLPGRGAVKTVNGNREKVWHYTGITEPEIGINGNTAFIGMRDGDHQGTWDFSRNVKLSNYCSRVISDTPGQRMEVLRNGVVNDTGFVHSPFFIFSHYADQDRLLLGTEEGVQQWKNNQFTPAFDTIAALDIRINSICRLNQYYVFGTLGNGLILVDESGNYIQLSKKQGLSTNQVNHVFADPESHTLWASTTRGISRIRLADNSPVIDNFTTADGLSSNQVSMSCLFRDTIWAATTKGVNYFRKNLERRYSTPRLHLDEVLLHNIPQPLNTAYTFRHDQNNLRFNFTGICYHRPGELTYRYRLRGEYADTTWKETSDRFILLNSLSPADYALDIIAVNDEGYTSKPLTVSFSITPPYWSTWWFIALIVLVSCGIIMMIGWVHIHQIKHRERLKDELYEVRQQALNSQINPHFIFNSLNSIQNFIFKNDQKNSNKYLSMFSKLMRETLDNSRKKMISLEEELNTLDIYLSLEKLRFKDRMDFTIDVEEGINTAEYHLPPLLFQPFAENAVWHGIMHKSTPGRISVEVKSFAQNEVNVTIEDNGIGRKNAAELKQRNNLKHKSAGIGITAKRIELIYELYQKEITYKIIDLYDNDGNACGTRVTFRIPKINHTI